MSRGERQDFGADISLCSPACGIFPITRIGKEIFRGRCIKRMVSNKQTQTKSKEQKPNKRQRTVGQRKLNSGAHILLCVERFRALAGRSDSRGYAVSVDHLVSSRAWPRTGHDKRRAAIEVERIAPVQSNEQQGQRKEGDKQHKQRTCSCHD